MPFTLLDRKTCLEEAPRVFDTQIYTHYQYLYDDVPYYSRRCFFNLLNYILNYYFTFPKTENIYNFTVSAREKKLRDDNIFIIDYIIRSLYEVHTPTGELKFKHHTHLYIRYDGVFEDVLRTVVYQSISFHTNPKNVFIIFIFKDKLYFYVWFNNKPQYKTFEILGLLPIVPVINGKVVPESYLDGDHEEIIPIPSYEDVCYSRCGFELFLTHDRLHLLFTFLSRLGKPEECLDMVINLHHCDDLLLVRHSLEYVVAI